MINRHHLHHQLYTPQAEITLVLVQIITRTPESVEERLVGEDLLVRAMVAREAVGNLLLDIRQVDPQEVL